MDDEERTDREQAAYHEFGCMLRDDGVPVETALTELKAGWQGLSSEFWEWVAGEAPRLLTLPGKATFQLVEPGHTCHYMPLCLYWFSSHHHHEDPGYCIHDSCIEIIMEGCMACYIEAMEEQARDWEADAPLREGKCPVDGTELTVGCAFGAPGTGNAAECAQGHEYTWARGSFHHPDSEAHILTIADVM